MGRMFTSEVNWMCLRRSKGGQDTYGLANEDETGESGLSRTWQEVWTLF